MLTAQKKASQLHKFDIRYKKVQEARLRDRLFRRLTKQMKWVKSEMESLTIFKNDKAVKMIERKTAAEEIKKFVDGIPYHDDIANDILDVVRPVYKKGANRAFVELGMSERGVSFDLVNEEAVRYLAKLQTLHLSDFKGSINRETKRNIIRILTEAADKGASYQETAKLIEEQGKSGVFSRARGQLIATNQIGRAYGEGNHEMIQQYVQETGARVQKMWITSEDDAVTEECRANEDMGWLDQSAHFNSGDLIAPRQSNPRCRCDTGWRQVDANNNPI